jgi:hypothetical protein
MRRALPTSSEAQAILASKRTRPPFRPPPHAGRALTPLIKALDQRFGQGADALKARWGEIVGERLATRTEPVKLVKGRAGKPGALEIRVDGPAAALIQHQAPEILSRVGMFLGQGAVDRLRIVQGPVRARHSPGQDAAPAAPARRRAPPLDAAAEAELAKGLEAATEGPLKSALLRLGREVLRGAGAPGSRR